MLNLKRSFQIIVIVLTRSFSHAASLSGTSICSASTTLTLSLVHKHSLWQSQRQCTSKNMKVAKCSPSQEGMWCFVYMREHLSVWMIYIKRESLSGSTSTPPTPCEQRGASSHGQMGLMVMALRKEQACLLAKPSMISTTTLTARWDTSKRD